MSKPVQWPPRNELNLCTTETTVAILKYLNEASPNNLLKAIRIKRLGY